MSALPVTLLGGYLGSGKTTLLNRVLAAETDRRLAVLVNDFGAVDVDARLIERADGKVLELANGCLCCSMSDDLINTVLDVLDRRPAPDAFLIETSGVAEPARVRGVLALVPGVRVDRTVVVAHAGRIRRLADDPQIGALVTSQLRAADTVALTHEDVTSAADAKDALDWLGEAVPDAPHVSASVGAPLVSLMPAGVTAVERPGARQAEHEHDPVAADASALFESLTLSDLPPVTESALTALTTTDWPGLERAKGFVRMAGREGEIRLVQFANRRWTVERAVDDKPPVLQLVGRRGEFAPTTLAARLRAAGRATDGTEPAAGTEEAIDA